MFRISGGHISRVAAVSLLSISLGIAASSGGASAAQAYSGSDAADYADTWYNSNNPHYLHFSNDCANFVSQSLHAGGIQYENLQKDPTGDGSWWMHASDSTVSYSWQNSYGLRHFLKTDKSSYSGAVRGVDEGSAKGTSTAAYTPDAMKTGDAIFYDWGQNDGISHSAIQVGIDTDSAFNKYVDRTGKSNVIDQHSGARHHTIWSGIVYNAYRSTTKVYFVHVKTTAE